LELLPELPASLSTLYICGCTNITKLPVLPQNLKQLMCEETGLRCIDLVETIALEDLDCGGCRFLEKIPVIPASLSLFNCSKCPMLYLPRNVHDRWRSDEKFVCHPVFNSNFFRSIVKLHVHLPKMQRKFLEKLYAPNSAFYHSVVGPRLQKLEDTCKRQRIF
jgi:hypothetical protein